MSSTIPQSMSQEPFRQDSAGDAILTITDFVSKGEQSSEPVETPQAHERAGPSNSVEHAFELGATVSNAEPDDDVDEKFRYKMKQRKYNESPKGYPQLAAYLTSKTNGDWLIFRQFDWVRARLILEQQDTICCLEEELETLDDMDASDPQRQNILSQRRLGLTDESFCARRKAQVVQQLQDTLDKYDRNLKMARRVREFKRPSRRMYGEVRKWMWVNKPLKGKESEYIRWREDLISLSVGEAETIEGPIVSLLYKLDWKIVRYIFMNKAQITKQSDGQTR